MTERQRRNRKEDRRPPSLHMRRLLRQAWFEVHRMLRIFEGCESIQADEAAETMQVIELCRRATARDRGVPPDWRAGLPDSRPPDLHEAVAVLTLLSHIIARIDTAWDARLIAAGIDPAWPDSGA